MSTYNGSTFPVIGKCSLILAHKSNSFKVLFIVLGSDSVPILELKTCEHLQLSKRICRSETNNERFFSDFHNFLVEIGTLNTTHHIEVKYNVKLVATAVCKVPYALKLKLEKELKRMVDLDITEPIEKPTDWVNCLVILEKPKRKLRNCLNPRPLNNAIKCKRLHLLTREEIFLQIFGVAFFQN